MSIRTLLDHHQRQVNRKAWADLAGFTRSLESAGELVSVDEVISPELRRSSIFLISSLPVIVLFF